MPLNWIVPARRAVVVGEMGYEEVLRAWSTEVGACRVALARWYLDAADAPRLDAARGQLDGWIASRFPPHGPVAPVSAATESTATVRTIRPMLVRLWKGPLRVLLEAGYVAAHPEAEAGTIPEGHPAASLQPEYASLEEEPQPGPAPPATPSAPSTPASPATEAAHAHGGPPRPHRPPRPPPLPPVDARPPTVTPVTRIDLDRGAPLELHVNAQREVTNQDARFHAGDVVEFPLFKLLALAGKSAYASLAFDPDGHFFLCNTVRGEGDGAVLHENRIAMRFQALASAGRGAFYALDTNVYLAGAPDAPLADRVRARGILYGGALTLKLGARNTLNRSKHRWWVQDNQWASTSSAQNLPSADGLATLPDGLPLTSAWTCSPCMLHLTYFMLDGYGSPQPRGGGVGTEVSHADSWLLTEGHLESFSFAWHPPPRPALPAARPTDPAQPSAPPEPPPPPQPAETSVRIFGGPELTRDARGHAVPAPWDVHRKFLTPITVFTESHHERSVVQIRKHARLVDDGSAGHPPVAGFLAWFEPLGGTPADMPAGRDEALFDFQATGKLVVANVPWAGEESPRTFSGFSCRPFVFKPLAHECVTLSRDAAGAIRVDLGGRPTTAPTAAGGHGARPAPLHAVSSSTQTGLNRITRFKRDALEAVHRQRRTYKPLAFAQGSRNAVLGLPEQHHAERALPYPTMAEAMGAFPTKEEAAATRAGQVAILEQRLAELRADFAATPPEAGRPRDRAQETISDLAALIANLT